MAITRNWAPFLAGCALATTLVAGASGAPTRALGTLQLKATVAVTWDSVVCPAGTPVNLTCYLFVSDGVVPGLGHVTGRYTRNFDGDYGHPCVRTLPNAVIQVAGKGEIEVSMIGPECVLPPPTRFTFDATITGGSGRYAAAAGSLQVDSTVYASTGKGHAVDIWTGTLSVPGLDFDVTAPTLQGAVSKTVRAPKNERRVRVRYSVKAQDAIEGPVRVVCTPRPGNFFKLGRTRVTCTATDSSGNTRRARFIVTVRRAR